MDRLTREAVRYLGYGKNAADDQTMALIADSFENLRSVSRPKSVYRIFDLMHTGSDRIEFGGMEVESRNLSKNLKGCGEIVLFGATLGIGVDRYISRASLTDMARAVVLQACAAALLEEYCDSCQEQIAQEQKREGKYLRPRFSPGYGDFSISYQEQLVRILDCAKKIGLTLTDSMMMTPTKSVTAVIGVSTVKEPCHRSGCEACEKKDCAYRRNT